MINTCKVVRTSKIQIKFTMGGQKKVAPSNYNTGIGIYDV